MSDHGEKLRESLSALMDDEANELELERVLSQIDGDEEMRETWRRYHIARDTISGDTTGNYAMDISRQVQAALGESAAQTTGFGQRLLRPLTSFAVAASVAATVILGGQQLAQLDGSRSAERGLVANTASPVGLVNSLGATTVQASFGTQPLPALQPATRTAYRELARQRMGRYMQEHAEHAALNTPQGLIPFARVPTIKE